jgi:nucleoside phosphorylase
VKIGLILALDLEFAMFRRVFGELRESYPQGVLTYESGFGGHEIYIRKINTGAGLLSASITATSLISDYGVQVLANCGIAGRLASRLRIGHVVIAENVEHYLHESKAVDAGKKKAYYRLDLEGRTFIPLAGADFIRAALNAAKDQAAPSDYVTLISTVVPDSHDLPLCKDPIGCGRLGNMASADVVCDSARFNAELKRHKRRTDCVEMEAAGIAAVAYRYQVPAVITRGISDYADGTKVATDSAAWVREFAALNAALALREIIRAIPSTTTPLAVPSHARPVVPGPLDHLAAAIQHAGPVDGPIIVSGVNGRLWRIRSGGGQVDAQSADFYDPVPSSPDLVWSKYDWSDTDSNLWLESLIGATLVEWNRLHEDGASVGAIRAITQQGWIITEDVIIDTQSGASIPRSTVNGALTARELLSSFGDHKVEFKGALNAAYTALILEVDMRASGG